MSVGGRICDHADKLKPVKGVNHALDGFEEANLVGCFVRRSLSSHIAELTGNREIWKA